MRSKLVIGGLTATVAFLLATNPVVVNAAGQITGADIKNGTVTGKDIKNNSVASKDIKNNSVKSGDVKDNSLTGGDVANGSLTSADLAAGTIPDVQLKAFKRFISPFVVSAIGSANRTFLGNTATVTVDGNDVVALTGNEEIASTTMGDDISISACFRPVGSAAVPSVLGGAATEYFFLDVTTNEEAIPVASSDILPAGTYNVGICGVTAAGNTSAVSHIQNTGFVQVLNGTGALAKSGAGASPSGVDALSGR